MNVSPQTALSQLERNAANRGPAAGRDQFAAVNLMKLLPEVQELIGLSKAGKALPNQVPEHVYPGGVLPPGDVIGVEHYTAQPEFQAINPAMWGQRSGGKGNAEWPRMQSNPDLYKADFYATDYPYRPERQIKDQAGQVRKIEGALPGMYNMDRDPEGIKDFVRQQFHDRQVAIGRQPLALTNQELTVLTDKELRRRGYTGPYYEDTGQTFGAAGYALTPVDLTGAAPNIDGMRNNLGLNKGASAPETEFAPRSPFAQVNAETMPGAEFFADRYKLYSDSPSAAAMLHADYERLLRNPDNSSVVAQMLGIDNSSARQGQGVYAGQRNPLVGVRIPLENPPQTGVAHKMDPRAVEETLNLSQVDRDRLDAVAITDGLLRDQDAVAWAYPVHMVDEADIPTQGLPWETVNSAIFRSPLIRQREVAEVGKLIGAPAPDEVIKAAKYGSKWEDYISVSEPADGSGGVMFTNIGGLPPAMFQAKVREIRSQLPYWESSYGMTTQWGRADTGYYYGPDNMRERIANLPEELRARVEDTLGTLEPYTKQIGSYHDQLNTQRTAKPVVTQSDEERAKIERMRQLLGPGWGM